MDSGVDTEVVFNTGAHDEDHEDLKTMKTMKTRRRRQIRAYLPPLSHSVIWTPSLGGGRRNSPESWSACARCSSPPRELARTCASWGKKRECRVKNTIGACRTSYKSLTISTP